MSTKAERKIHDERMAPFRAFIATVIAGIDRDLIGTDWNDLTRRWHRGERDAAAIIAIYNEKAADAAKADEERW